MTKCMRPSTFADPGPYTPNRRLLHALPLHHIHGAVVAMHAPHVAGACVEFLPKFSPASVWDRLMVGLPWRPCTLADTEPLATHGCELPINLHIGWNGAACRRACL